MLNFAMRCVIFLKNYPFGIGENMRNLFSDDIDMLQSSPSEHSQLQLTFRLLSLFLLFCRNFSKEIFSRHFFSFTHALEV